MAGLVPVAVAAVLTACGPTVPGTECPMFPSNSHWHAPVTNAPVLTNSTNLVNTVGATKGLKADFGSGLWEGGPIGIPFVVVAPGQPKVNVTFEYDDESDHGGYPVPANPPIEGGPDSDGDRHILMVEPAECKLYELYAAYPNGDGTWHAGSGAIWDLRSNAQRPLGWTSADAAGLPIVPGLVRYDEVAAGKIEHAIRMTVPQSRRTYLWPASHFASSSTDVNRPAMGQRFRLKSTVNENNYPAQVRPIIVALKTYGAIIADNGSSWYMSGAPDERWDNDQLQTLSQIKGSDFVAVDGSGMMIDVNSGQAQPIP
ncbi:MAG: hypothetical protein IPG97_07540 [Microthrixaceae bacterium]|nr:hypothetical protein [Microthrixaceae bacterium]